MTDKIRGSAYILQHLFNVEMVKDPETAIELAEVLFRRKYGADSLKLQQPLSAKDEGDSWTISGNPDALDSSDQSGPIHIGLMKADASVISFQFTLPRTLRDELEKVKPNTDDLIKPKR
jgi:NTF2 fold immunity protein